MHMQKRKRLFQGTARTGGLKSPGRYVASCETLIRAHLLVRYEVIHVDDSHAVMIQISGFRSQQGGLMDRI